MQSSWHTTIWHLALTRISMSSPEVFRKKNLPVDPLGKPTAPQNSCVRPCPRCMALCNVCFPQMPVLKPCSNVMLWLGHEVEQV